MLDRQPGTQGTITGVGSADHGDAPAGRPPTPGKVGFVGLGHMGTVMAANLPLWGVT